MSDLRLLGVDTTTMDGSVALLHGLTLLCERRWTAVDSHSNLLLGQIDACLATAGARLEDTSYFVPVIGPGSFTGIRIGLGTVQGLTAAVGRPLLGISALEALAQASAAGTDVMAVIDARRDQVYAQPFRRQHDDVVPLGPPCCEIAERWLQGLKRESMLFVGSGATRYRRQIEAWADVFHVQDAPMWLAEPAARLALQRVALGRIQGQPALDALYVRPPDVRLPAKDR